MAAAATLPLAPLEALARSKADVPDYAGGSAPAGSAFTDELFATMIGVSTRAIARWRVADGRLPWHSADRAATSMGMHGSFIWGEEWEALDADVLAGDNETLNRLLDKALDKIGESAYFKKMQAADAQRTCAA